MRFGRSICRRPHVRPTHLNTKDGAHTSTLARFNPPPSKAKAGQRPVRKGLPAMVDDAKTLSRSALGAASGLSVATAETRPSRQFRAAVGAAQAYRGVLVQLDGDQTSMGRACVAAALARDAGADLTGVFLKSRMVRQYVAVDDLYGVSQETIDQVLRDQANAESKAQDDAQRIFATATGLEAPGHWASVNGDDPRLLIAYARRGDLVVMPPIAASDLGLSRISAADVAIGAGGPVLVVPQSWTAPQVGKRVLIAWNGGREAARALRDAWPLLARAEIIQVVDVRTHGDDEPEGALRRHFERHGLLAEFILDRSEDAAAAEILRRRAQQLDADLIVMGLFGHPRLQEWVLGGVSRAMLDDPIAPLFIAH